MNAHIQIDLFHDWATFLSGKLSEMGYAIPATTDDDRKAAYYYEIADRLPTEAPREIHKAACFNCPPEHVSGLSALESKIRNGEEIRPHLSLGILDPDNFDGLLLDWGIHHLHLGTAPHPSSTDFVERTGPLLYVRFTEHKAFFIGIIPHGKWSDRDLIRILHRNWPETLQKFRVKGVLGLRSNPSDSDVGRLRRSQVNALVEIEPGVIYCALGGGITTAGTSMRAIMSVNQVKHFFTEAEMRIARGYDQWRHQGAAPNAMFRFRLEISDGDLYAYAPDQKLAIKIRSADAPSHTSI